MTVVEAATRLSMTPQGVRKAVREGRLGGSTRLLPSGKREYAISAHAVEAYLARGDAHASQFETLQLNFQLTTEALHDKEKEIIALRARLQATDTELTKVKQVLRDVMRAFLGDEATQSEAPGGAG